jgi:O-antigen ligase
MAAVSEKSTVAANIRRVPHWITPLIAGGVWGRLVAAIIMVGATAAGTAVAIRVAGDGGWVAAIGLLAATILAFVLCLAPVHVLPSIAVAVFAFIPVRLIPSNELLSALPLPAIIMAVWFLRRFLSSLRRDQQPESSSFFGSKAIRTLVALLFLWCVVSLLASAFQYTAAGWLISFTAAVLLPLLVVNVEREAAALVKFIIIASGAAGAYAVLEAVLQFNLIVTPLYSALGHGTMQHWSVYRAEVTFGHPLFAATFLAIGGSIGLTQWATRGGRLPLVMSVFALAGVVATASRGAVLAAVIAIAVSIGSWLISKHRKSTGRLLLLLGGVAVGGWLVVELSGLLERSDSLEAIRSNEARARAWDLAVSTAARGEIVGSGPGTSSLAVEPYDARTVLENSGLQLLVSIGVPGLLLVIAILGVAVVTAWQSSNFAAVAGVIAYAVAVSGYNAIDARRAMHLLLAVVVIIAIGSVRTRTRSENSLRKSNPGELSTLGTGGSR